MSHVALGDWSPSISKHSPGPVSAIAAVNRLHFTPRLAQVANASATQDALRQLRRNSVTELVIGTIIIAIVAVLGVTPHGSYHFR